MVAELLTRCPGCGIELPAHDGPVHPYMTSSPACWARYGEVLAREYGTPELMSIHRLTVDAYAVQHPGRPEPRSIRSVGVHLVSLHAVLERGATSREATALMSRGLAAIDFDWLTRPGQLGSLTVLHVWGAEDIEDHRRRVEAWARSAWEAWAEHHATIRRWAAAANVR